MTVASGVVKAGPFEGNASTTVFPFTFKCFQSSDLLVVHYDGTSVETELTEGVDYSVALNGNQETSPGGSVTYPLSGSPLAAGKFLTLVSSVAYTQTLDLILGGNWNPDSVEQALDRITLMAAQNKEASTRSLKVGIGTGVTPEAFAADIEAQSDAAVASAAAAAVSEGNAGTSATNAGNSASAASTSATNAGNSASAASTSATNASNSASAASTSATNASNSASAASTSATNAGISAAAAEAALESFQGQYYGALASDPTLDPNGDAPTDGDFYLNTGLGAFRFRVGGAWESPAGLTATYENSATITGAAIGGDFTDADNVLSVYRVGRMVTLTMMGSGSLRNVKHASDQFPETANGILPAWARPAAIAGSGTSGARTMFDREAVSGNSDMITVAASGVTADIRLFYPEVRTSSRGPVHITYLGVAL